MTAGSSAPADSSEGATRIPNIEGGTGETLVFPEAGKMEMQGFHHGGSVNETRVAATFSNREVNAEIVGVPRTGVARAARVRSKPVPAANLGAK